MNQNVVLSGINSNYLQDDIRKLLEQERPPVIGIAAAFVSVDGVKKLCKILEKIGNIECRLIAGTDNAITHPEALYLALENGWNLKIGKRFGRGIFHPKLIVAGDRFLRNGSIAKLSCIYVGSSNLTDGGLRKNVECGLIANADGCIVSASSAFSELWKEASPATNTVLKNYAASFAERARKRKIADLIDLGIGEAQSSYNETIDFKKEKPPERAALGSDFAVAAWAGLESFTGGYKFQVEFPKDAGKVISQLVSDHINANDKVDVFCPDDQTTRSMKYTFYADNSMFRLNMPNDLPGVNWARENKRGIALVEVGPKGGAPIRIRLLKPGQESQEIVQRSFLLGTWGKTTTRQYGWY